MCSLQQLLVFKLQMRLPTLAFPKHGENLLGVRRDVRLIILPLLEKGRGKPCHDYL